MSITLKIWILQTGEPLQIDEENSRPMRAMNLSNYLLDKGHDVTLLSAAFNHRLKKHRSRIKKEYKLSEKFKIILIPSPGYKKNVSIQRLYDHLILAKNLKNILEKKKDKPDVIFLGFPPIEINYVMSIWSKKNNIPYLIDIKDQWPQFFVDVSPYLMKPFIRFFFSPYFYLTKKIINEASAVTANSNSFLSWSLNFSNRPKRDEDIVIPLTVQSNKSKYDHESLLWWEKKGINISKKKSVIFIGSHYPSLDLDTVIDAACILKKRNIECDIIICGSGELTSHLKKKSKNMSNVFFPGWVNNNQISCIHKFCFASLSPFRNVDNYLVNIPNKVVDSLANGLPILSPLKGEVSKLIKQNHIGMVYEESSGHSLAHQILLLFSNNALQIEMSKNARLLYEKQFSYDKVYGKLATLLEKLSTK